MPLTALVLSSLVLKHGKTDYVLCCSPFDFTSAGVTTFTSQNFGAKQFKRIVAGLKQSCLVSITWSVTCALLYVASPFLAGLVSGSDNAVIIDNASVTSVSAPLSYFRMLHL
ncbi:MAG: MATE family efflux transporter [Streptococcus salivarius]